MSAFISSGSSQLILRRKTMKEFLAFKRMITPLIIQILFWIGAGLCVLGGLIAIISGAASRYGGGGLVLGGLLTLILGPLAVRVWCELVIVMFRMNESLTQIADNTRKSPAPDEQA